MENLKNIKVTGEISLQSYDNPEGHNIHGVGFMALILGPTGAGKSSFLEALAGSSQKLSLSSNQLSGYTQHISVFRVVNASVYGDDETPLYVVDTPGFSDSKFSEKEILDMASAWLSQRSLPTVRILYFVPINGTRLPGTRRKTLQMLKTFLQSRGENRLTHLTFVTTMWDTLYSERALGRGQSNFEQLRDTQLKDFIDDGAKLVKFWNTPLSAIQTLDAGVVFMESTILSSLEFRTPELYRDLYERIENALLEKRNIEDDLAQSEAQTSINLRNILERNWRENDEILTKFIRQFTDYGDPPKGWEDAAQRLRQEIAIVIHCPPRTRSIFPKDSTEPDFTTPAQLPSIHVGDQISQTPPPVDAIDPLVVESDPGQPERTLAPIITPERSPLTQPILPKASTELDIISQVHSSSIHTGDHTFPSVDTTNTPDVELERSQPGLMSTVIITPKRQASFRTSLKEILRRTLEGATRPWKKWFGPKH